MARFYEKIGKIAKNTDEARQYVRQREEFSGTLVSMMDGGKGRRYAGIWHEKWETSDEGTRVLVKTYTVYSYGTHFPMYVWDDLARMWYGNDGRDKYSRTTSKHLSKLYPGNVNCYFPTDDLVTIAQHGAAGWVKNKMESA